MRIWKRNEYVATTLALGLALGCGEEVGNMPTGASSAASSGNAETGGVTSGGGGVTSSAGGSSDTSGGDGETPTTAGSTGGSSDTSGGEGETPTTAGSTAGTLSMSTSGTTEAEGSTTGTSGTTEAEGSTTGTSETTGEGGGWVPPPPVDVPPLPEPPDYSEYPVDEMGRPIVVEGPLVNWVVVLTPDAMSAREGCADLVANCHSPGERSIDACMLSAPACATDEPWNEAGPCCAAACFADYSALRVQGVDPLTAYLRVLYDGPICMPGVDAMLGGAP